MTIKDLLDAGIFTVINEGDDLDREITGVFCCDLLSVCMSRGIEGACWVTVMGNINSLAVMSLTDMALIVLAEGTQMDEAGLKRAEMQGYTVLGTEGHVFDAGLAVQKMIDAGK